MTANIKIALIQEASVATASQSLALYEKNIRDAAQQGAQLILLPELHNHPYFPQSENVSNFDLAESIPGPSTAFFGKLAKELQVVIVVSLFERRAAGIYHNTACVLEKNGDIAGIYRKMHIPDDPGFYEKFYFTPGDLGFHPIQTSVGKLGVLVCWDQWFPEAARLMALRGADILIYPTAIAWSDLEEGDLAERQRQLDAWITVQRGHAIANNTPVAVINRVGKEACEATPYSAASSLQFWGNSFVAGPQGEILVQANADDAQTLICEISKQQTENVRRIWPFFRDRRIDAYENLTCRFLEDNKEP